MVRLQGPSRPVGGGLRRDPKTVLYIGDKRVGEFMKKKVFEPGQSLSWKGLAKHATAELNPKAFAKDFEGNVINPRARNAA